MTLVPLRNYKRCPKRTVIVVDKGTTLPTYSWRFGPDTINPWPAGDYYDAEEYAELACDTYAGFYRTRAEYREYQLYPEHLLVDIGL